MKPGTYAQRRTHAHDVGGETQTEATAKITDSVLKRSSLGFLYSVLSGLESEAAVCHTESDYAEVRAQIVRVRKAIQSRG